MPVPMALEASRAAAARGSLFLRRDFSEQALRQAAAPPEPVFSQRELAEARAAGFAEGHASGHASGHAAARAAAEAARTMAETRALEVIAAALDASRGEAARVADQAAAALARALVAALRAAMPALIARTALGETSAMLAQILPGLSREPRVLVEVPPALAPGIAAALARLAPEQRAGVEVFSRDGLASGEARMRWAGGHARRRPADIWRAILDGLEAALGEPEMGETEFLDGTNDLDGTTRESDHGQ